MTGGLDAYLRAAIGALAASPSTSPSPLVEALFTAQALSRHVDFAAREMQAAGDGFYTIASAGHESNAIVALALQPTDPALLHYRSGGFYCARAGQVTGIFGSGYGAHDPVPDLLHSLAASADDPISGGRHKVFGNAGLHIIPQTSTIASHLPRALGLAFALDRGRRLGLAREWPDDAIAVASFGDASANHSTAQGTFNAAAHCAHQHLPLPLLLVCEDNGIGISVRSPQGWTQRQLARLPGLACWSADGSDPAAVLAAAEAAVAHTRGTRRPAVLHLRTVRFLGHAGSDVELGYRSAAEIAADYARDPILGTARWLAACGHTPEQILTWYDAARDRVRAGVAALAPIRRLSSAAEVMRPLERRTRSGGSLLATDRASAFAAGLPEDAGPLTLAQSITATLTNLMAAVPQTLCFGEDVAIKGGVYGVTRGLLKKFGAARVFDTLLDEQTILGLALGSSLAGLLPLAEIQYLAYLHNAEDQLRGEAATLAFFSNGQYSNGIVVRIPGLAYQRGFGGHFHNDNSIAVLRDIPGILVACPSGPDEAPGLLRTLAALAIGEGRVGVFLEPIARYHSTDRLAAYAPPADWRSERDLGRVRGDGHDLLIVTFGNGVAMSETAVAETGVSATIFDLRWLAPLPLAHLLSVAGSFDNVLIVDETRASGGVSEGVITALVDSGYTGAINRVTSRDSVIPLGPAAAAVLLSPDDITAAIKSAVGSKGLASEQH